MQTKRPNRPKDTNQLGKLVVDLATGNANESYEKNEVAAAKGRRGGTARARSMSRIESSYHGALMAKARWSD